MITISDLIKELEEIKENNGDLDVFNLEDDELSIQLGSIVGAKVLNIG